MKAVKRRANPLPTLHEAIVASSTFDKLSSTLRKLTAYFLAGFVLGHPLEAIFGSYGRWLIKPNTSPCGGVGA
jgi:hypothetical protein